ncbi:MAG: Integrase [Candidatus Nitrospira kreftii]|uniref:Integrase n=1 Tax=Candidatus Nitrospira kreftii TaxID=2652173 RepID=A0A7S8IZ47_9BACT|nr:MAG: Integrase [Candidatus Nitrospira kreftii]
MDGTRRWRDNVFVERLWRSLKYKEASLYAYETVHEAQERLAWYLTFHNQIPPHCALDEHAPDRVCWKNQPACPTAA